jgi:hypothetical protein
LPLLLLLQVPFLVDTPVRAVYKLVQALLTGGNDAIYKVGADVVF